MAQTTDNSGMGVILGILIAVVLIIGGYFLMKTQGARMEYGDAGPAIQTTEPAAGSATPTDAPSPAPAPAPVQ